MQAPFGRDIFYFTDANVFNKVDVIIKALPVISTAGKAAIR